MRLEDKTVSVCSKSRLHRLYRKKYISEYLRTVPTFVTAPTFSAYRDTRVSRGNTWVLLHGLKPYSEKAELSKCLFKKKIGGNHAFFQRLERFNLIKNAIHCFVF